jgi:Na+/melibiose symporter-like transporter
LLYLGWTLVTIPYTAWGAELSVDYHERARITSLREGAGLLGILLAGALMAAGPQLGLSAGATRDAVGWAAILLGAPSLVWLLSRVPELRGGSPGRTPPLRVFAAGLWRNGPFLRLLAAWFLNGIANGLPAVLFPLYVRQGLQLDEAFEGGLIFAYFASAVVAIPLWLKLSERLGKQGAWCAAMLLCCAAFAWVPWLSPGAWPAFLAVCVITGAALGADLTLPPALQADVVDYDTWKFGRPRAAVLFALWSMASKLALAAAVGIAFPALDWFGFSAQGSNSPEAVLALAVIYALVPVVIKLVTVILVWTHPLTPRRHRAIRSRLAGRTWD